MPQRRKGALFVFLLCLVVVLAKVFITGTLTTATATTATTTTTTTYSLPSFPGQSLVNTLSSHHKECSYVERHPDQCAFVEASCKGFSKFYLKFYYCSELWKPISMTMLLSCLLLLFGSISVVASDFFSINLQTIASKLQMSESMAGVTVLAFGNGSPDLFSTFSAMDSGAGSLAIGELIGAAFFIVSVVSGCMGIIRPFQSKRITFMRDASFLTGAIMMMTWIVYHQRIFWYHGIALIAFYLSYVFVVVVGAYHFPGSETPAKLEQKSLALSERSATDDQMTEASRLLYEDRTAKPPRLAIPVYGFSSQQSLASSHDTHFGHIIHPVSSNSSFRSSLHIVGMNVPRTTSTNGSLASRHRRHAMTPRVGIRTSLFSAIEFQEQITSIRRDSQSTHTIGHRRRETSVPHHMSKRPSQNSVPGTYHARSSGRPRASTFGDQLLPTHIGRPTTPESTNSSTGMAEDYFAYISAGQHGPVDLSNCTQTADADLTIPEIRLAPALQNQPQTPGDPGDSSSHPIAYQTDTELQPQQDGKALSSGNYDLLWMDVCQTLFPTLQGWNQKTAFARLSSLVAMPVVLIFTLTLPVVEPDNVVVDEIAVANDNIEEDEPAVVVESSGMASKSYLAVPNSVDEDGMSDIVLEDETGMTPSQGWCRWLLATQAIAAFTFVFAVLALNQFISPSCITLGFGIGCICAIVIFWKTKANEMPEWYWMTSFAGFVIALNWIFLLANEMVGLLQALGTILNISDAIMGLTIFAMGNSVGDLVANTAIAKMGFPTMAISACYAGPLLNMVLGVGISSTYQTFKSGKPYEVDIPPSILVSCAGLITVLLSTLMVVNLNGYCINKELGWWMIIVYSSCCLVNVLLECNVFK